MNQENYYDVLLDESTSESKTDDEKIMDDENSLPIEIIENEKILDIELSSDKKENFLIIMMYLLFICINIFILMSYHHEIINNYFNILWILLIQTILLIGDLFFINNFYRYFLSMISRKIQIDTSFLICACLYIIKCCICIIILLFGLIQDNFNFVITSPIYLKIIYFLNCFYEILFVSYIFFGYYIAKRHIYTYFNFFCLSIPFFL